MVYLSRLLLALAILACGAPLPVHALIQATDVRLDQDVTQAFFDEATARVFTLNAGAARYNADATLSVIEADGRATTRLLIGAHRAAILPGQRTLVVLRLMRQAPVSLINLDTLEQVDVPMDRYATALAVNDATGKAYLIGQTPFTGNTMQEPGKLSGWLAELDLRSHQVRIAPVNGFEPRQVLVNEAGTRVVTVGVNYLYMYERYPGYAIAFDTQSLDPSPALEVGRYPEMAMLSADGDTLYVVSTVFWSRAVPPRDGGTRAAMRVIDARTMKVAQTIVLPDLGNPDNRIGLMTGAMTLGPTPEIVYVMDTTENRLHVVNVAEGSARATALESVGHAIAFNPVTRHVLVSLPRSGSVAVFSAAGDRVDTVAVADALAPNQRGIGGNIAIDAMGVAYVTSGHAGAVSLLRTLPKDPASVVNLTDLWWNPAQPGWGLFVDQQGTTAFATLFVRDAAGRPEWYFMSEGKRQGDGAFAGTLFRTTGPAASAAANAKAVGTMRIDPEVQGSVALRYDIDGRAVSTPIERQVFAAAARSCGWAVGTAKTSAAKANFTSLWFDAADPGWGLAVSQRGDMAFGVLFSYGADGQPSWAVMSNGVLRSDGSFGGSLHQYRAGSGLAAVGSMELRFDAAGRAALGYVLDGTTVQRGIQRQAFAPLVTDCASE